MVCAPVRRDNPRALARGLSTVQAQTMLYLTCTMISSVDLAHYGVPRAKNWVFVECGTSYNMNIQRAYINTMSCHSRNDHCPIVIHSLRLLSRLTMTDVTISVPANRHLLLITL